MTLSTMAALEKSPLRLTAADLSDAEASPIDCVIIGVNTDGELVAARFVTITSCVYHNRGGLFVDAQLTCRSKQVGVAVRKLASSWGLVPPWRHTHICIRAEDLDQLELGEADWELKLLVEVREAISAS